MRVCTAEDIGKKRNSVIEGSVLYAMRKTFSDSVKLNNGDRPVSGEILKAFNSQVESAREFFRKKNN